jgi:hypothetical protein
MCTWCREYEKHVKTAKELTMKKPWLEFEVIISALEWARFVLLLDGVSLLTVSSLPHKGRTQSGPHLKGTNGRSQGTNQGKRESDAAAQAEARVRLSTPLLFLLAVIICESQGTLTRLVCREYEAKIKQFDVKKQKGAEELVRLDRQRKNIGMYTGRARN